MLRRGELTTGQARIVSGTPYWPLGYAVEWGNGAKRRRVADLEFAERIKAEQGEGVLVARAAEVPAVVGLREVTELTGWADLSASAMRTKGQMPAVDYPTLAKPVWLLDTLMAWAEETGRTLRAEVVETLREGRYDGPGSQILRRGVHAPTASGHE